MPMPVTVRVDKSVADTMDSQMQASFVNHIFNFFAPPASSQGADAAAAVGDSAPPVPPVPPGPAGGTPDLPVLLSVLKAAGFIVKFSDKSDFGGVSYGCRAIILCKRSGTRVVLDGEGPCTCPTEEEMKRILDTGSQAPSRAASPTPSQSGLLEETFRVTGKAEIGGTIEEEGGPGSSSGCSGSPPPAPGLTRQGTWSRDDDVRSVRRSLSTPDRRLSAPPAPAQSSWATITGDELNVMAATDLLQEAISLLSGIKKVSMRNTPVGPSRGAARRVSADTFLVPQRPVSSLSRSSSVTSGLASSRSSSSLSEPHSDTPRPLRPGAGTETRTRTPVRRAASATTSSTRAAAAAVKSRAEAGKKGSESSGTPRLGSKLPSFLKASSSGAKSSPRPPLRSGLIPPKIKTNASFTSAKLSEPKVSKSPDIESVQL